MSAAATTALGSLAASVSTNPPDRARRVTSYRVLPDLLPPIRIEHVAGAAQFAVRVAEPYHFQTPEGVWVTIPRGFISDLTSSPWALWSFVAPHELGVEAPVIHDFLIDHGRPLGFTREDADDVFEAVLERQRINPRKAAAAVIAVRLRTRMRWNEAMVGNILRQPPETTRAALGAAARTVAPLAIAGLKANKAALIIEAVKLGAHIVSQIVERRRAKRQADHSAAVTPIQKTELTPLEKLWNAATIAKEAAGRAQTQVDGILLHRDKYEQVEKNTGVPWFLVGVIHWLVSGQSFQLTLNSRALAPSGNFDWVKSASDLFIARGWNSIARNKWTVHRTLDLIERFTSLTFRDAGENSPLLWGGTGHYAGTANKQIGAVPLLRELARRGFHLDP